MKANYRLEAMEIIKGVVKRHNGNIDEFDINLETQKIPKAYTTNPIIALDTYHIRFKNAFVSEFKWQLVRALEDAGLYGIYNRNVSDIEIEEFHKHYYPFGESHIIRVNVFNKIKKEGA